MIDTYALYQIPPLGVNEMFTLKPSFHDIPMLNIYECVKERLYNIRGAEFDSYSWARKGEKENVSFVPSLFSNIPKQHSNTSFILVNMIFINESLKLYNVIDI